MHPIKDLSHAVEAHDGAHPAQRVLVNLACTVVKDYLRQAGETLEDD